MSELLLRVSTRMEDLRAARVKLDSIDILRFVRSPNGEVFLFSLL